MNSSLHPASTGWKDWANYCSKMSDRSKPNEWRIDSINLSLILIPEVQFGFDFLEFRMKMKLIAEINLIWIHEWNLKPNEPGWNQLINVK